MLMFDNFYMLKWLKCAQRMAKYYLLDLFFAEFLVKMATQTDYKAMKMILNESL